jgi:hypothetical protein
VKVVILDLYYPAFLESFYRTHSETEELDFESARERLLAQRFGTCDSYSHHLKKLGHEAEEIITNDSRLQCKWLREQDLRIQAYPDFWAGAGNWLFSRDWRFRVIEAQMARLKPDVIYVQEQNLFTDAMVAALKKHARLVASQIASPLVRRRTYQSVDLVLTSFPHYVPYFRSRGIQAEYVPLCFDRRIVDEIRPSEKKFAFTFVGGMTHQHHARRFELLERAAAEFPLEWFGYGRGNVPLRSALRRAWRGEAWGLEMYRILAASWMTLNCHGEISGDYANNARLFEATGAGACLITDWKSNLTEFFEPEQEVVSYRDAEDLVRKIRDLWDGKERQRAIGERGQGRTLAEHTYDQVIPEIVSILKRYL